MKKQNVQLTSPDESCLFQPSTVSPSPDQLSSRQCRQEPGITGVASTPSSRVTMGSLVGIIRPLAHNDGSAIGQSQSCCTASLWRGLCRRTSISEAQIGSIFRDQVVCCLLAKKRAWIESTLLMPAAVSVDFGQDLRRLSCVQPWVDQRSLAVVVPIPWNKSCADKTFLVNAKNMYPCS